MSPYLRMTFILLALALAGCASDSGPDPSGAAETGGADIRKIHLSVIRGLSDQGKSEAALAFLDDYELRFPGDPNAKALRGEALLRTGHREEAEQVFVELFNGGYRPAADFGLGQTSAAKGNWTAAAEYFANAARLAPTNVRYLNNFGYALLKTGNASQAYDVLARATQLDPKDQRVRNNYILAAMRSGRAAEAEKVLRQFDSKERERIVAFVQGWSP